MWLFGGVLGALIGGASSWTWQGAVAGGLWGLGIACVLWLVIVCLIFFFFKES